MNPPKYTARLMEGHWHLCENDVPVATCASEVIAIWLADLANRQRQTITLGGSSRQLILSFPATRPN